LDLRDYQEQQLSVALDSTYGHWDQAKLATRLHGLEVQHLDMDAVCLPPFDVSRILQQTLPQVPGIAKETSGPQDLARTAAQRDDSGRPQGVQNPPALQDGAGSVTGTARRDAGYTLTLTVTPSEALLDLLIDVHAAAKSWRDNDLEVIIGE